MAHCAARMGIPFKCGSFVRAAREALHSIDPDDEETDYTFSSFRYRSDGFVITHDRTEGFTPVFHVWAVEVEDTNPLSPEKLNAYLDLWFYADASDHAIFHLVLTDRYGRGEELDLCAMWYAREFAESSAPASVPATTEGGTR